MKIRDMQGRLVYQESLRVGREFRHQLKVKLPAGVYLLGVEAEGQNWYQKVSITP
ncbi:MAG: T9SS type A sorting domain-containing protein [Bacteroidota bacterium]